MTLQPAAPCGQSLDVQGANLRAVPGSRLAAMGLHDRDYYREELTRRDGRRSIVFRFEQSFTRFMRGLRALFGWR